MRGWVSGRYLEYIYDDRRVLVPAYAASFGAPIISFSFGNYWDNHYRGYDFYDRDRRENRRDRKFINRERNQFERDRGEIRADIQDADTRAERRALREERRDLREDFREEVCEETGRRCD